MKKVISLVCGFALTTAAFAFFTQLGDINASAITPSYDIGPMYEQSAFYRRLAAIELTGDNRYDFISVALSQLCYHEGDSDLDMDGMNVNGNKNFVEYNRIYGRVDNQEGNGVSFGYEWCAAFVSWCLRQAGVEKSAAITEISCSRMTSWYKEKNMFYFADKYIPFPGDIIMFQSGGKACHVGLVLGVKEGSVYTVEGNNGGKVGIHSYNITDNYILGYCVPDFKSVEGVDCNVLLEENIDVSGKYIVSTDSLNVRSEPNANSGIITTLDDGDTVVITAFSGEWGKININGKDAWVHTSLLTHEKYQIYTIEYNFMGGEGNLPYQRKFLGDIIDISDIVPRKKGYVFIGWATDSNADDVVYSVGDEYKADENIKLFAVWKPEVFTIVFYNDDGSIISKKEYLYQDWIEQPAPPTKTSDGEYSYVFAGWNKKVADVAVANTAYTATYSKEPLPPKNNAAFFSDINFGVVAIGVFTAVAVIAVTVLAVVIIYKNKKAKR